MYCDLPLGLRTEAKAEQEKHYLSLCWWANIPTVGSRPWQQEERGHTVWLHSGLLLKKIRRLMWQGYLHWPSSSCPLTSHSLRRRLRTVSQACCFWGETRKWIQFLKHWWVPLFPIKPDPHTIPQNLRRRMWPYGWFRGWEGTKKIPGLCWWAIWPGVRKCWCRRHIATKMDTEHTSECFYSRRE